MMKKTISMLLCICLIICCSACSINNEINPSESETTPNQTEQIHIEPPKRLYFDSFDDVAELWAKRNDATLSKYLLEKNLSGALYPTGEVNRWFDHVGDIKLPYIKEESKYTMSMLSYDFDTDSFDMIYVRETFAEGKSLVRLICVPTGTTEEITDREVAGNLTVAGEAVTLYHPIDPGTYKLFGIMKTSNSEFWIQFSKDVEMSKIQEEIADYIEITTMMEIIQQRTAAQSDG